MVAAAVLIFWTMAYRFGAVPIAANFGVLTVFFAAAWVYWDRSRREEHSFDRLLCVAYVLLGVVSAAGPYLADSPTQTIRSFGVLLGAVAPVFRCLDHSGRLRAPKRPGRTQRLSAFQSESGRFRLAERASGQSPGSGARSHPCRSRIPGRRDPAAPNHAREQEADGRQRCPESFSAALEDEALHDYLVQLTGRLGGLAVFRDLARDASWAALDREEMFSRFRRQAVEQGLQTVVAIGLQSAGIVRRTVAGRAR